MNGVYTDSAEGVAAGEHQGVTDALLVDSEAHGASHRHVHLFIALVGARCDTMNIHATSTNVKSAPEIVDKSSMRKTFGILLSQ